MLFSELEKFCEDQGVNCVIKLGRGNGSLEDAVRQAMSDHLERRGAVGLLAVRQRVTEKVQMQRELRGKK